MSLSRWSFPGFRASKPAEARSEAPAPPGASYPLPQPQIQEKQLSPHQSSIFPGDAKLLRN